MNFSVINRLLELEARIAHKIYAPPGERPFIYRPGNLPVLISAPHATVHERQSHQKREEGFTGALANILSEITGAHALFSRYQLRDDPNWDKNSQYKLQLQKIVQSKTVKFLIDLHGMSNRHKVGVALGSMNGRACPDQEAIIVQTVGQHFTQTTELEALTFSRLRWDHFILNHSRFTGGLANHTITRFSSQQLGIPAVQIELCRALRIVNKRPFGQPASKYYLQIDPIVRTINLLQNLVLIVAFAA